MITNSLQEFYQFFCKGRPIIAIDYGLKKVGLAISSPDHHLPMPFKLIISDSEKQKLAEITRILEEKMVCAIVIGWPINMDGTKSNQTIAVEQFAAKLEARTKLPIFFQDERLTSKAADNFLKDLGINRRQRNSRDDLAAASMILETTLDSIKKINI
ncbi:MAG: Holliday junction resolvase RuvX [Rickettsiaceae bacterium]